MDLYKILGVPKDATKDEIKRRYYKLAKKMHPDKGEAKDDKAFKEIALAYSILSDEEKRKRYDKGESVDDVGVDNRRSKLVGALTELLVSALKGNDVRYSDLVAHMRAEVKAALAQAEAQLEQAKGAVKKCDEAMARFEGEIELVQAILTSTRGGILRQQERVQAELDSMKEIYNTVNKLKYRVDERPKGQAPNVTGNRYRTLLEEIADFQKYGFK